MKKYLITIMLVILSISWCSASNYYCNGVIVNTNTSAELFCQPLLNAVNSVQSSEHNQEAYRHNIGMYQNCLNSYNYAKAEMQKGLCKPATKRVYTGSCGEIITEYSVSGNVVSSSSCGGDVTCAKRKYDSDVRKILETTGIK